MDRSIRRLGVFLMLLFCALFVQLNYIQVIRANDLNTKTGNDRPVKLAFSRPRGTISTADGVLLAESVPSNDQLQQQRLYPQGELYANMTGYLNYARGATGLERAYNEELAGRTAKQQVQSIGDLFEEGNSTGNLTLNVRSDVQETARTALGDQKGTVIALNPQTGGILGMWSNPSFDPNLLANHDYDDAEAAYALLSAAEGKPLLPKAYQEIYPPGSTFKAVTGATGVESGQVTPTDPVYPTVRAITVPGTTRPLPNFAGSLCGGALFEILAKSCNTSFAEMGLQLGGDLMTQGAEAFGFNSRAPFDLPTAESRFPTDFTRDQPKLAQSSIGQNDVAATPLQMALVAAGIANDGVIMEPRLVDVIRNQDGGVVERMDPTQWKRAVTPQTAEIMREAMREVVRTGSATRLQIEGVDVGAKTGTAQFGPSEPLRSHAWVIAWAGPPGQKPTVAVAVIVEDQPGLREQTGGQLAAPIAREVILKALEPMPPPPASTDEATGSSTTTAPGAGG